MPLDFRETAQESGLPQDDLEVPCCLTSVEVKTDQMVTSKAYLFRACWSEGAGLHRGDWRGRKGRQRSGKAS